MIPRHTVLRVARPTDKLEQLAQMYRAGLGFELLSQFSGHNGFDGVILGHPQHPYHLEFIHHRGTQVGNAPSQDHLLVFYLPDVAVWRACCAAMTEAGFRQVTAYNSYWDERGRTFEDIDGYRVVLENEAWLK